MPHVPASVRSCTLQWIALLGWCVVYCSTITSDVWTQQAAGQSTATLRAASQPWLSRLEIALAQQNTPKPIVMSPDLAFPTLPFRLENHISCQLSTQIIGADIIFFSHQPNAGADICCARTSHATSLGSGFIWFWSPSHLHGRRQRVLLLQ